MKDSKEKITLKDINNLTNIYIDRIENTDQYGLYLSISIRSEKLQYSNDIWIDTEEFNRFLQSIDELEGSKLEEIILFGMSKDEFSLKCSKLDSLGHFSLTVIFNNPQYIQSKIFYLKVSASLQIELSNLKALKIII